MPLSMGLADPISNLVTNTTNIVDKFGGKDQKMGSLSTLNCNANENGALSFLDNLLPANDLMFNSASLMKDQHSIFGEIAF